MNNNNQSKILLKWRWFGYAAALCIWLCFCTPRAWADKDQWRGAPVPVGDVTIVVQDDFANGFDWPGLAMALIGLKQGDELTAARLEQAETALASLALVQTDVSLVSGAANLTFTLQPFKRIKSIGVDGNYPLFESDVLKVMTINIGDLFSPTVLINQVGLIAQRYREEGYIDPKVDITWRQDSSDGHFKVMVGIEKGPAYTLSKVKISGNRKISDVVLMGLMGTWRRPVNWIGVGRFVAAELKADVQKLVGHYRSSGYADVKIENEISQNPAKRQVQVRLIVHEGPRYTITFSGNHFFSEGTLRGDMEIFTRGNRDNVGLRRSIQNIRRRYLDAGFADVKVRKSASPEGGADAAQVKVNIEIEEGVRHIVDQVAITGNHFVGVEEIRSQMLTRPAKGLTNGVYVSSVLQEDVAAVRALYQNRGFLNPQVKEIMVVDERTQRVAITLTIQEGVQTLVGSVTIEGDSPVAADKLLMSIRLKPGKPFQPYHLADDENAVAARIAPQGYPHVQVKADAHFSEDQSRADIVFQVVPGPAVMMGRVFYTGNIRTRPSTLNRRHGLKENAPFSLAEVLAAQRKLRDLDLFQSVQVRTIGLKERTPIVHLLVTMVEKPAHYFELGGGYETSKGLYGRTKVGDKNFMGSGKDLSLSGEQSQVGYLWETGATDPHLLGTDVSANLKFYIENQEEFNQDFGYDTMGGRLSFSYPLGRFISTRLGLSYERREQYLRESDADTQDVDPEALEPRAILVTTPSIQWDTRNSFIQPRKGGLAVLSADISKGLQSSLDNFVKYKFDLRKYHSLSRRLTLAGRGLVGYILPYGVDGQVPEDQLFFLGGTTDVRGFDENMLCYNADQDPVGGRLALALNLEARYEVSADWELTIFLDSGSVQKTSDKQCDNSWQYAAGLGVRYITPIGPIGLLYGLKLNPRPGESSGQIHFSIGYTF